MQLDRGVDSVALVRALQFSCEEVSLGLECLGRLTNKTAKHPTFSVCIGP